MRLICFENNIVERSNPYMIQLLHALNQMKGLEVTEEQIINIFKNYGNA